ncbi:MAG: hypothetical protein WBX07_04675 [Rhodoplanes sp.]
MSPATARLRFPIVFATAPRRQQKRAATVESKNSYTSPVGRGQISERNEESGEGYRPTRPLTRLASRAHSMLRRPLPTGERRIQSKAARPLDHMSPAFPRMMHICFHIRDDVDFNKFIADLEAEAARRGMTQVRANRVITVTTEQQRLAAPIEANSNGITEGQSNGWRLIYCKGSEGEQLEFVQALGPVKSIFDNAREGRRRAVGR